MLYWECKRRLTTLRQFRILAVDYFQNIQYAGWQSGGVLLPLNETAQNARNSMNLLLSEVTTSLDLIGVSHVIYYQEPRIRGGGTQFVDIVLNVFSLREFQIPSDKVFDCIDRGIGDYQRECKKLFANLFNPFYWFGMLAVQVVLFPFKFRGDVRAKNISTRWNRTEKLTLIGIVLTAVTVVATVTIPELRRILHLDKPATTIQPSPTQATPGQTTPPTIPAQTVPEKGKSTKPKGTATPPPPATIINAQGGIPIVENHGTVNNPTVNNYGPQLRIPVSSIGTLASKLAGCPSGPTRSVPHTVNPSGRSAEDAANLAAAFAQSKTWNWTGAGTNIHGQDIGDDGPIPDPVGFHIVVNKEKLELGKCVQAALEEIGVESEVETKELNDDIVDIVVGNAKN